MESQTNTDLLSLVTNNTEEVKSYLTDDYKLVVDILLEWLDNGACSHCVEDLLTRIYRSSNELRARVQQPDL